MKIMKEEKPLIALLLLLLIGSSITTECTSPFLSNGSLLYIKTKLIIKY